MKIGYSTIIEYAKTDQPPLFFLYFYLFFKYFGYSEFTGCLASAVIGIIGIPLLYGLGKEIKNEATGLFTVMLTTVNYIKSTIRNIYAFMVGLSYFLPFRLCS
ncbi:MAG: glycosyltransferase family 39 protein [Bacteroidetes bacterium]|nr:glycosyltransferase family 39 protein [Bacteroidota bacterium]